MASRPYAHGGKPEFSDATPFKTSRPTRMGVTVGISPLGCDYVVVPTHVGVNRSRGRRSLVGRCRPHARGGEPVPLMRKRSGRASSPRTRGEPVAEGLYKQCVESSPRTWG